VFNIFLLWLFFPWIIFPSRHTFKRYGGIYLTLLLFWVAMPGLCIMFFFSWTFIYMTSQPKRTILTPSLPGEPQISVFIYLFIFFVKETHSSEALIIIFIYCVVFVFNHNRKWRRKKIHRSCAMLCCYNALNWIYSNKYVVYTVQLISLSVNTFWLTGPRSVIVCSSTAGCFNLLYLARHKKVLCYTRQNIVFTHRTIFQKCS
jgi:hypothetical protein